MNVGMLVFYTFNNELLPLFVACYCWEITSNFNCDLESKLGFLVEKGKINLGFHVVEEKTIPWCERKFIPY